MSRDVENSAINFNLISKDNGEVFASKEGLMGRLKDLEDDTTQQRYVLSAINVLEKGKEWLYYYTKKYQPRTANILLNESDFFVFERKSLSRMGTNAFQLIQELSGQFLYFDISPIGTNPYDEDCDPSLHQFLKALPKEIYMAYYYHFEGIHPIVNGRTIGSGKQSVLPMDRSDWPDMERYLLSIDSLKKYKRWIEKHFPGKLRDSTFMLANHPSSWGTGLRIFLDTRKDKFTKEGDVFLLKTEIDDKVIYHIKDGDVKNMRILADYVEAIDKYCEHILLGKEGRFDFLPYTSDFVSPVSLYPEEVYEITKDELKSYESDDRTDESMAHWDKFAPYRKQFDYEIP